MSTPSANVDQDRGREQACSLREKARKDVGTIMTNVILPLTGPSSNPVGVCPIKSRMRITKGPGGELWLASARSRERGGGEGGGGVGRGRRGIVVEWFCGRGALYRPHVQAWLSWSERGTINA